MSKIYKWARVSAELVAICQDIRRYKTALLAHCWFVTARCRVWSLALARSNNNNNNKNNNNNLTKNNYDITFLKSILRAKKLKTWNKNRQRFDVTITSWSSKKCVKTRFYKNLFFVLVFGPLGPYRRCIFNNILPATNSRYEVIDSRRGV